MKLKKLGHLGYGGFSTVDLVEDDDGNEYARKTYQFNQVGNFPHTFKEKCKKRFINEANFIEATEHPNIVTIQYKDLECDPPFYLMPVAEIVLSEELKKDKTLGGNQISAIMDIISAIEELHSYSKYHRDMKPGNVLKFRREDGTPYYAVSDFGLLRDENSNKTVLTTVETQKGSDDYTAPELSIDIRNASAQSDIYSIGCILHDMYGIDRRTPFTEIVENSPYGPVFRNCTKINEDNRFDDVGDLRDAIMSIYESYDDNSSQSDEINEILSKTTLDEQEAKFLTNYIDDKKNDEEGMYILGRINFHHIDEVYRLAPKRWRILAKNYCEWIQNNSFNFELCDGYANRLLSFYDLAMPDIKNECLLALLELGTSHNRFYVERKAVRLMDSSMNDDLARSLKIDFSTDKRKFCATINKLVRSIGYNTDNLHPEILKAYQDFCK